MKYVWKKGPPPSIGWWPASVDGDKDVIRWWNGKAWSDFALPWHTANVADKVAKKRQAKGETSGNSKLTKEQVRLIRLGFMVGFSNKQLADRYSVSSMCISRIRSGKTWGHV